MVYKVIGLMSGSSLDGLDIAYVHLHEISGKWSFEIIAAECIDYDEDWKSQLKNAKENSVPDFLKLNTRYGKYLGKCVTDFIDRHSLHHQVHFIASHGHTVFHEPHHATSTQIGCGATIAAYTKLPVISDLRNMDVASGGQGAPIVPIGDRLLFADYEFCLNIGGIVNITHQTQDRSTAFDICPGNQILNALTQQQGEIMDENGKMAAQGKPLLDILEKLNQQDYYQQAAPKSLSNEAAQQLVFPSLLANHSSHFDLLHTATLHIAEQIAAVVKQYKTHHEPSLMLVTGGGAFNTFLTQRIEQLLLPLNVSLIIPDATIIQYKEALVMALIGTLRWREETNVLASVTGAEHDTIGGALWMGRI